MSYRFGGAARPVTLALCLGLAACGGSGGGTPIASTPTPPSTPTPTPTPTPPPSNANTALTGTLLSESFTNDAVTGAATYNTVAGGISGQSAAGSTLSVVYDATTGGYTISSSGRSQTFLASDRVAGPGTTRTYRKTNGAVTDDLTLTGPGTAGALQYQYVAAGFWQRQTTGTSSIQGSFDAFTYGVETPDATLPRTGSAGFAIDMIGAMNATGEVAPYSISGSGTLLADFARATVTTDGSMFLLRQNGTRLSNGTNDGRFSGSATLSSTTNTFGGTLAITSIGGNSSGPLTGRFYGPTAQEVGATFATTGTTGNIAVGTITGRRDASLVTAGNTLAGLTTPTTFTTSITGLNHTRSGNAFTFTNRTGGSGWPLIEYTPATQTYRFVEGSPDFFGPLDTFSVGPAQRSATQSDARYTSYDVSNGSSTGRVLIYKTEAANPEIQLTYTSFADLQTVTRTGGVPTAGYSAYIPFGIRTPVNQVPTAGTATYTGVLRGTAVRGDGAYYDVAGTSSFAADFASFRVTATLVPVGTNAITGSTLNFGSFAFTNTIDITLGGFSGFGGSGSEEMRGFFYGPRADEVAATFNIRRFESPNSPNTFEMVGVAIGRRP